MLKKLSICIFISVLSFFFAGSITTKAQNTLQGNDYIQKLIQPESKYMQIHDAYIKSLDPLSLLNNNSQRNTQYNHMFLLDTVYNYTVSENPQRYIYSYTSQGFRESTLIEKIVNGHWQYLICDSCTYDSLGNKLTSLWQVWENDSWLNDSKETYTYSTNNNMLTYHYEIWDNDIWVNDKKGSYTYDASGKVLLFYAEVWNNSIWVNYSNEVYTYDEFGNMITAVGSIWQGDNWVSDCQHTYTYDNNNLILGLTEKWENGLWVNFYRENYIYNEANKRITFNGEYWDNDIWVNDQNIAYTYDNLDFLTMIVEQDWENGNWSNTRREQYVYSFYGGLETSLIEVWDNDDWVNLSLSQNDYDENGNTITAQFFNWVDDNWEHTLDGVIKVFYDYSTKVEYFTAYNTEIKYTSITVGVNDIINDDIKKIVCYPNPVSVSATLKFNILQNSSVDINLFDTTGKRIKSVFKGSLNKGKYQFKISTEQIPNGIYILSLVSNNTKNNVKLMILK